MEFHGCSVLALQNACTTFNFNGLPWCYFEEILIHLVCESSLVCIEIFLFSEIIEDIYYFEMHAMEGDIFCEIMRNKKSSRVNVSWKKFTALDAKSAVALNCAYCNGALNSR